MNFRNSDCATIQVDYIEMLTVQCAANTLFLTLEQTFGRIKSFYVCRSTSMLIG